MSKEILLFLYQDRVAECTVSAESLGFLGIGVIFLALSFPLFSMFQAIGKADLPVKVLGNGKLTKKLTVKLNAFSASAAEKINAAGGKAEVI